MAGKRNVNVPLLTAAAAAATPRATRCLEAAALVQRRRKATPCLTPLQVSDLSALKQRLAELEEAATASDLWERRAHAQAVLQQLTALREEVAALERFCGQLEDLGVALELLEMEVGQEDATSAVAKLYTFSPTRMVPLPALQPRLPDMATQQRLEAHSLPMLHIAACTPCLCRKRVHRSRWRRRRVRSATPWLPRSRAGSCASCWGALTTTGAPC